MGLINDIKNRSLSGNELHANKHNWGKAMLAYEKACSTYTGISKEDKDKSKNAQWWFSEFLSYCLYRCKFWLSNFNCTGRPGQSNKY